MSNRRFNPAPERAAALEDGQCDKGAANETGSQPGRQRCGTSLTRRIARRRCHHGYTDATFVMFWRATLASFLEWVQGVGPWGAVLFTVAYVPAAVLLVPG